MPTASRPPPLPLSLTGGEHEMGGLRRRSALLRRNRCLEMPLVELASGGPEYDADARWCPWLDPSEEMRLALDGAVPVMSDSLSRRLTLWIAARSLPASIVDVDSESEPEPDAEVEAARRLEECTCSDDDSGVFSSSEVSVGGLGLLDFLNPNEPPAEGDRELAALPTSSARRGDARLSHSGLDE